jgi:hypothetical protein
METPRLQAMFHRQVSGDGALLALAQARFRAAGLGPEFYPNSPGELEEALHYQPSESGPYTDHLPRDVRVTEAWGRDVICDFAARFPDRARGLVVHDEPAAAERFHDYVAAVREVDGRLRRQGPGPLLLIEYAAGLEPGAFVALHEAVRDCPRIAAVIDVSHVGIRQCQRAYERMHPGTDVCRLKPGVPEPRERVEDVQAACGTALPVVLEMVAALGRLAKPLHFHLHDGHPASTFSIYGVSDHLSFFQEIPVPFSYRGCTTLPTLYGPLGLKRILDAARAALADEMLSFTLEVHPPEGRLPLGEHMPLFRHWRDLTNAERMNHWLEVLLRNHRLLRAACA